MKKWFSKGFEGYGQLIPVLIICILSILNIVTRRNVDFEETMKEVGNETDVANI